MQFDKHDQKTFRHLVALAISLALLAQLPLLAKGQSSSQASSATCPPKTSLAQVTPTPAPPPDCKEAKWGKKCEIRINRKEPPVAPGTITVASGTQVSIVIHNKSPFESAKFDATRTEVAPPPSAASGVLGILSGATKFLTLASISTQSLARSKAISNESAIGLLTLSEDDKQLANQLRKVKSTLKYETEKQIESLLNGILQDKNGNQETIEGILKVYEQLNGKLLTFFNNKCYCIESVSQMQPADPFAKSRTELLNELNTLKVESPISVEGDETNLANAKSLLKKLVETGPYSEDFPQAASALINRASGKIQLFKEGIANLGEARKEFNKISETLENLENATCRQTIGVVTDRQSNIAGNITFTNIVTGKADSLQLYTKISYRDLPRASLSAGVIISPLEKRSYSTVQVSEGPGTLPTDPVGKHAEIRGEASKPQVIPFTFVNVRLGHWRVKDRSFTFNIAPGVGINPNSGSTEVEFALGPSFGWDNIYFFGGFHFGRQTNLLNGFKIGDRVPDSFVTPVGRSWQSAFGFGVSYRVPLP